MLDSEKIELLKNMLNEFWSNGTVSEDGCIVLLNAIASVLEFKRN